MQFLNTKKWFSLHFNIFLVSEALCNIYKHNIVYTEYEMLEKKNKIKKTPPWNEKDW